MVNKNFLVSTFFIFVLLFIGGQYFYNEFFKETKTVWETSANSLALEASKIISTSDDTYKYEFSNGELNGDSPRLETKENLPNNGILIVSGTEISYGLSDGKWCSQKPFFSSEIKTSKIEEMPNNYCGLPQLSKDIITVEANKVIMKKIEGNSVSYGYKISSSSEDTIWQKSNIFENLESGKNYIFYLKISEYNLTGTGINVTIEEQKIENTKIEVKYISTEGGKLSIVNESITKGNANNKISYTTTPGYKFVEFKIIDGTCAGEFNKETGICSKVNETIKIQVIFNKIIVEEPSKLKIYYDANGGVCEKTIIEIENGTKALPPKCTKTGYKISSYYRLEGKTGNFDSKTGIITQFTDQQKIKINWEKISSTLKVIYDANGGTCDPGYEYVEEGGKNQTLNCTKEGNKIAGYSRIDGTTGNFDAKTGIVTDIKDNQKIKINWESDFPCGDNVVDARDYKTYSTVKIGNQCWFKSNLAYEANACLTKEWTLDAPYNACRTHEYNGKTEVLYQWDAAMNGATKEGSQGSCPVGFRVSTDNDWKKLELFLGMSEVEATSSGNRGGISGKIKMGGETGLNIYYSHSRDGSGELSTYEFGNYAWFWTSTPSTFYRNIDQNNSHILRNQHFKYIGGAVRCVRDM